ncbi:hypothetical protein K438DRAFT_2023029 [Mycena galopus ATCC 62051]|nr:hypothetical protein K438DRAFT_2023029 [Mycena galopus ATCC 62051]
MSDQEFPQTTPVAHLEHIPRHIPRPLATLCVHFQVDSWTRTSVGTFWVAHYVIQSPQFTIIWHDYAAMRVCPLPSALCLDADAEALSHTTHSSRTDRQMLKQAPPPPAAHFMHPHFGLYRATFLGQCAFLVSAHSILSAPLSAARPRVLRVLLRVAWARRRRAITLPPLNEDPVQHPHALRRCTGPAQLRADALRYPALPASVRMHHLQSIRTIA